MASPKSAGSLLPSPSQPGPSAMTGVVLLGGSAAAEQDGSREREAGSTHGHADSQADLPSAGTLLLGPKRGRSVSGGELLDPPAPKKAQIQRIGSVLKIPATVTPQPFPPSKSSVPGVMAPGPNPTDVGCSSSMSELPTCEIMWPVLPFIDAIEHLLKDPASQPLTFHRRVTRPTTNFIAAVAAALQLTVSASEHVEMCTV